MKKILLCFLSMLFCSCFSSRVSDTNELISEKNAEFKPVIYKTKTEDGWTIALKRFRRPDYSKEKLPVILCHGFNYNDRFWYLDKTHSLAYYLYEKGYDVWAVSLRGSGESTKPGMAELRSLSRLDLIKLPETLAKAGLSIARLNWNIDDHINKDMPAMLELVQKETGYEKVNWIGHSLGGMIVYAYLGGGGRGINAFVPVASPLIIPQPPNDILAIIRDQRPAVHLSLLINSTVASQFQVMSGTAMKSHMDKLFYNSANMEKDVVIEMYRRAVEDISPGVIDQLRQMISKGRFLSADGKTDYAANLSGVNLPVLCIGGMADNLASTMSIYYAYENVPSKDKAIRIFSIANGYSIDYGHNDLLLGKKAYDEVYPYIYNWLARLN